MLAPMAPRHVELLVVGGGLAGTTLALAAASAGIVTALVERAAPGTLLAAPYDGRTTAIAWGSQLIFRALGFWSAVEADASPIREIRVADGGSRLFLHYDHALVGDHPLGFIVENRVLRRALLERCRALPNLVHLAPMALERVEYEAGAARAFLADGSVICAALVAAADGKDSPLRTAAGIRTIRWSYPQTAIVCTVKHAKPHRGVAVEHFLPAGPFAILPMTGDRSSIVWTEASALAPRLIAASESDFHDELARRFGDHLGALAVEGPRWSYPLSFLFATRTTAPRLALVGEAAHLIHPIAGQGFNLGIRDIAALAETIVDARRLGLDIGAGAVLRRFEAARQLDAALLGTVTDGLNRLFSNDAGPLRLARDLGLAAVDRTPPLKRLFMRHAMGTYGNLPRLARGERL
ncbi:MAG TPA: UbiH/UbiF/VisC/COQ6 family ubiquinone biosynthesis hydroxylase [Stellaceae bacterium]|nr:UbiH/UbiF/VisC/COQ6 family ubiquinone biosynthesis hydroxylase [Stellaceae bacterium]